MSASKAVRDTGIVALVPADIPRPLPASKGRAAVAILPGKVAIHAGESESDALAFAAALRASYAAYLEAHPRQEATGHDMTMRATVRGKPAPLAPIPPTPSGPLHPSRLSDGLVAHRCDAAPGGRVRTKYVRDRACVACEPDSSALRERHIPSHCGDCDSREWHAGPSAHYSHPLRRDHEYRPVPNDPLPVVPDIAYLDVPRIIPADLCEPYGRNVPRSGTAPRVAPALPAPEPKPRATRKATAPKPVREPIVDCGYPGCGVRAKYAHEHEPEPVRETTVSPEPRIVVPIVPEPARKPERGYRPEPCARCGRADFKTDKGRSWHVENNPDCAKYARPERHAYVALAS